MKPTRVALWTLVGIGVGLLIVGAIFTLGAIRTTQLDGTPLGKKLIASSDRIIDCTEPGGKCFREGQKRTAKAVGSIAGSQQEAAAAGAWCATQPKAKKNYPAMLRCVKRVMAENRKP